MHLFNSNKWLNETIYILIVLVLALIFLRILRFLLTRFLNKSSEQLRVDPTHYHFLKNALSLIVFVAALIVIFTGIPELKQLGLSLFAGAGIIAAIIGFASQAAFSNIISGIFIVIFKPFRVGDVVQVGTNYTGVIEDITLRHTVIRNFENQRFVIPNSLISSEVILNSSITDEKMANFVVIGISYDSDIDLAVQIIREVATAHTLLIDNRSKEDLANEVPLVVMRVISLSESSVDLRATCWTKDFFDGFVLKTDLYKSIKQRFDKEGVEIPFPHRTLVMKSDGKVH